MYLIPQKVLKNKLPLPTEVLDNNKLKSLAQEDLPIVLEDPLYLQANNNNSNNKNQECNNFNNQGLELDHCFLKHLRKKTILLNQYNML